MTKHYLILVFNMIKSFCVFETGSKTARSAFKKYQNILQKNTKNSFPVVITAFIVKNLEFTPCSINFLAYRGMFYSKNGVKSVINSPVN